MNDEKQEKKYYGRLFDRYCECRKEMQASKASDVNFGEFTSDVVAIYCLDCGIIKCFKY